MINLNSSAMVYAPIKRVFDFVSTPENDFQWQYGTLATATITNDNNRMGIFFRSVGHLMGRRNLGTFEVTEYEPNSKYGFKSLSGPLHSQTSYTFEMTNDGTRVNISSQVHVTSLSQMNEHILGEKIKNQLNENLTMLKDLLEEKVSSFETSPLLVC